MITSLTWTFTTVAVIFAVQAVINAMATAWYTNGIHYRRTHGHDAYYRRRDNPPWYVRYFEWLERHVFDRKASR